MRRNGKRQMMLVLLAVLFTVSLVSCRPQFQTVYVTEIPVQALDQDPRDINLDSLLESLQASVASKLPDARYRGLVFSGKCKELPTLRGRLIIDFMQAKEFLNGPQILIATFSVNVMEKSMTLTILDESTAYPSTILLPEITDQQLKEVAQTAYQHIIEQGLDDCDVTLTQGIAQWDVRCGSLDDFIQQCRFTIDVTSGKVVGDAPPR